MKYYLVIPGINSYMGLTIAEKLSYSFKALKLVSIVGDPDSLGHHSIPVAQEHTRLTHGLHELNELILVRKAITILVNVSYGDKEGLISYCPGFVHRFETQISWVYSPIVDYLRVLFAALSQPIIIWDIEVLCCHYITAD